MRGLLALPQNVHDLIAIVKPCFAVPSLLLFFVTKFTKKPAPMRRFADAVSVDTASACPASDFTRKRDRFRRSDGTLQRVAAVMPRSYPVVPDGALAGPLIVKPRPVSQERWTAPADACCQAGGYPVAPPPAGANIACAGSAAVASVFTTRVGGRYNGILGFGLLRSIYQ